MGKHLHNVVTMMFNRYKASNIKHREDYRRWAKAEYGRDWEYHYHRIIEEDKALAHRRVL